VTTDELYSRFHDTQGEYTKCQNVTGEILAKRRDLHACLLLDRLVPSEGRIVGDAQHDVIFLETSLHDLALAATEEDILNLIRCGVRLDTEFDCLTMFT